MPVGKGEEGKGEWGGGEGGRGLARYFTQSRRLAPWPRDLPGSAMSDRPGLPPEAAVKPPPRSHSLVEWLEKREGGGEKGGCSGAHSSPEQYTGLPATPPHKGGCLATGTYRPMAAGPGPAAPDGCTAGPHSRAIGGRLLVSRRDTHVPARAGAGRSRTPRVLSEARSSTAPSAAWRPRRSRRGAKDPRQLATRRGQPPAQPRQPSLGKREAQRSWEPLLPASAGAG